jgi:hypothetical protein
LQWPGWFFIHNQSDVSLWFVVVKVFGKQYLRELNAYGTTNSWLAARAKRGVREMLGCIDCMH